MQVAAYLVKRAETRELATVCLRRWQRSRRRRRAAGRIAPSVTMMFPIVTPVLMIAHMTFVIALTLVLTNRGRGC